MKKSLVLLNVFTMAFVLGLYPSIALGEKAKDGSEKSNAKKVEQIAQDQTAEKRKVIMLEASSAISETENALKALDEEKKNDALASLERATGKLEIILARDPKLAFAPMGVTVVTHDLLADTSAVNAMRSRAEELMGKGRLQEARLLVRDLASETVISVSNIPLATYPLAIKRAVKLIDENKEGEAKQVLQTALNTLVVADTIVPLPVVAAQELLKDAETLAENTDRKEEENRKLAATRKNARAKLEFAEALGYGTKADFKDLYEQITEIEQKTENGKSGVGFFDKIKMTVDHLFNSNQPASPKEGQSVKD